MPIERQSEQWPHRREAMRRAAGPDRPGRALRLPHVKSNTLDSMGITQRKLNGNYLSWLDEATPEDKAEGALWYPVGHDWGQHMSDRHDVHPDKVYGVMSKTSPQRKWISRALNGQSNLGDTHNIISNYRHNPTGILTPGGISGSDNLKQALRVMGADDDPEAILAAFMGDKKDRQIPKTLDFYRTLRDPEMGGAGNYMAQPAVADSWAGRSMLWTKSRWEDALNGGRPLDYPGRGTGKGLDKPMVVKDFNRHTGKWEPVGLRPPSPTVIAARVLKYAGGYDRMRNAMRNGAAVHGLPFTHEGQATVWKMISGNQNPAGQPVPDLDLHSIDHPEHLYNEQWLRRANGPRTSAAASFRLGSAPDTNEDPDDGSDDQWGTREDVLDVLKHISSIPFGWDAWEGCPMTKGPHDDPSH